jgi:hypothetical protein
VSNYRTSESGGDGSGKGDVTEDLLELKDDLKGAIDNIDSKLLKYFRGVKG